MRVMTTSHEMYGRLIRCIVLNSFTSLFRNNKNISGTIAHICLSAMSSKSTDVRNRVDEFNYLVKVYREKILKDCQRYSEGGDSEILKFQTPRQWTEASAFEFFDANRDELMKKNSMGQFPSMISMCTLQESARRVLGVSIDYKSNDKCVRHMYFAYRNIALKWWQSRVTNRGIIVSKTAVNNAENLMTTTTLPKGKSNGKSVQEKLPVKKRAYKNVDRDEGTSCNGENQSGNKTPQNKRNKSPVFWVRSDQHFRSLMLLEQKKKQKKQMRQAM